MPYDKGLPRLLAFAYHLQLDRQEKIVQVILKMQESMDSQDIAQCLQDLCTDVRRAQGSRREIYQ